MNEKPSRTSISLSPQLDASLDALAAAEHTSKRDIVRKALALYAVAAKGRDESLSLGLFDSENKLMREIVLS